MVPSTENLGLGFLRQLNLKTIKDEVKAVTGFVPPKVADYLLNKKRKEIMEIEIKRQVSISIEIDENMIPGENKIVCCNN